MRIINKKYLLIIILVGMILTGVIVAKPKENIKLDNVILKQEVNNKTFAMYTETDNGYEKYEGNNFPTAYVLNLNKSKCVDKEGIEIENVLYTKDNKIGVRSNKSLYCYLYFDLQEIKDFEYTESYQEFIAPKTGKYQIELWGAGGGDKIDENAKENTAGRGAYTKGTIELKKNDKLYVFVGENPTEYGGNADTSIFNGGGYGESPGGGATDIRLNISETGNWDDFDSLKSRIMVAAGGGGGAYEAFIDYTKFYQRGDGGALEGIDAQFYVSNGYNWSGHGGTQTGGGKPGIRFGSSIEPQETPEMIGKFGSGGYGINARGAYKYSSSGGGGGYYGGGHGNHSGGTWTGGGGGSSFISGYEGCIAISEDSTENNIIHKDNSIHYSGKVFTDAEMLAGNESMPTYDGEGTMIGNTGYGHAKIKLIVVS